MIRSIETCCHGRGGIGSGIEQSHRRLLTRLVALTRIAAGHVPANGLVHAWPVEATLHLLHGLVLAEVTTDRRVVALAQDASLQREGRPGRRRGRRSSRRPSLTCSGSVRIEWQSRLSETRVGLVRQQSSESSHATRMVGSPLRSTTTRVDWYESAGSTGSAGATGRATPSCAA